MFFPLRHHSSSPSRQHLRQDTPGDGRSQQHSGKAQRWRTNGVLGCSLRAQIMHQRNCSLLSQRRDQTRRRLLSRRRRHHHKLLAVDANFSRLYVWGNQRPPRLLPVVSKPRWFHSGSFPCKTLMYANPNNDGLF